MIIAGTAAAAVVAAGAVIGVTQASSHHGAPAAPVSGGPVKVDSITPAASATGVNGAAPIVVKFSAPVSVKSHPHLSPGVPGTWKASGDSMIFTPSAAFRPSTTVTVSVPGGAAGVRSTGGGALARPVTQKFTTGAYSQRALAETMAQLGYLPMSWTPTSAAGGATPAAQTPQGEAYDPPDGTYTFNAGYPAQLRSQWNPDAANPLLKGAVMAFKSQHHMTIDGSLTPVVWTAIFKAQQQDQVNHAGYTYALASKASPESLTIWHDGKVVVRSPANTGAAVAPTADGTFPVYERLPFQVMQGTNPDGSHYSDPVQYVSYFNGGDAVHYFSRGVYGAPQSLGCVELPFSQAKASYPYLTYGSLVTVAG